MDKVGFTAANPFRESCLRLLITWPARVWRTSTLRRRHSAIYHRPASALATTVIGRRIASRLMACSV